MKIRLILFFSIFTLILNAQVHPDFTIIKSVPTSPVKNQNQTGTCWCFATVSFIETEEMRMGKPMYDLSEMYIVKHAYSDKAKKYIRYHGKSNFSEGGQAHDVLNVIRKFGIVPEDIYSGLINGNTTHNHSKMQSVLEGMLNGVINSNNSMPSTSWMLAFESTIDSCLGQEPKEIKIQNKNYDPIKFSTEVLGFNPDNYVEITSYMDYPYNQKIDLELPDNWSHNLYYNVNINDFMSIIENSINKGYTVAWDGDVSEKEFKHGEGNAVLSLEESDIIKAEGIEKERQKTFDDYRTTDDHLMHITGIAKDKEGNIFYLTKNSWGQSSNKLGGYLYMSEAYVQLKSIAIMVHKDAVPKYLKKKLGL